ncbi:MAG: ABC transporter permease [Candidatus Kapabacteria bacterium]|nr:ABC transporter permease [Candidatus Kapabacteria bacterium]
MSKISVIIAHEYLTRVKAKWFLISTVLGPLGLILVMTIPIVIAALSGDGDEAKVVLVDRTDSIAVSVVAADTAKYELAGARTEADLSKELAAEKIQAYVIIPATVLDSAKLTMYSQGGSGISFESSIVSDIEPFVVRARLSRRGVDTSVIDLIEQGVEINSLKVTEKGVEADASAASAGIGYVAGFLIYMLIFLYGSMVMRGVVEEKANRIVEVIASSVRPFDIMLGKVVGIGLVGLTQLAIWAILGIAAFVGLGFILGPMMADSMASQAAAGPMPMQGTTDTAALLASKGLVLPTIPLSSILMFIFNFFAGYFLYASLFAAVGSAVDQEADAQSLTLPITMPIILTMMFIGNVINEPNGTLAVTLSLIPLFSPILMTVRVAATDVPAWQMILSVLLSCGAFLGSVWLASRIYRIGILSYGKKPKLKEIIRWITLRV